MRVIKTDFGGTGLALRSLLKLALPAPAALEFGTVVIPRGSRQPPQGVSRHEGEEISLILEGRAVIEWHGGRTEVGSGDLVHLAAGEAHATEALERCLVYFVLAGDASAAALPETTPP